MDWWTINETAIDASQCGTSWEDWLDLGMNKTVRLNLDRLQNELRHRQCEQVWGVDLGLAELGRCDQLALHSRWFLPLVTQAYPSGPQRSEGPMGKSREWRAGGPKTRNNQLTSTLSALLCSVLATCLNHRAGTINETASRIGQTHNGRKPDLRSQ